MVGETIVAAIVLNHDTAGRTLSYNLLAAKHLPDVLRGFARGDLVRARAGHLEGTNDGSTSSTCCSISRPVLILLIVIVVRILPLFPKAKYESVIWFGLGEEKRSHLRNRLVSSKSAGSSHGQCLPVVCFSSLAMISTIRVNMRSSFR
jgi:hypothetical protein